MLKTLSMQLKEKLANELINICSAYGNAEVIRDADTDRVLDIRPKIIAPVSPEEANELEQNLHEKIEAVNQQLQDACEKAGRPSSFRRHDYVVKRICADEVTLSVGEARKSEVQDGKKIIDWCQHRLAEKKEQWITELKEFRPDKQADISLAAVILMNSGSYELWNYAGITEIMTAIQRGKIVNNSKYLVSTISGSSYRVTYYNYKAGRRIQMNLGHILIVETNNPHSFRVDIARLRRTRSDCGKNEIASTSEFSVRNYESK